MITKSQRRKQGAWVKRRNSPALCWALAVCLGACAGRSLGQEPIPLPQPQLDRPPAVLHEPAVSPDAPVPSCWRRLWEFVTFRQPPRPRQCQGCVNNVPNPGCTAPLYRFFENRFPTAN